MPLVFMAMVWILLLSPDLLEKYYINKTMFNPEWLKSHSVTKLLPIYPKDSLETFDYGVLTEKLELAEAAGDQAKIDEVIAKVKEMTGRDVVTVE
jgi:hypothetical protein